MSSVADRVVRLRVTEDFRADAPGNGG